MFEKSGFPRIDAIFEAAKGSQFVPSGYLHFKAAIEKAGPLVVHGWTQADSLSEIWSDTDNAGNASQKRWIELVDWFRKKLFAEELKAYYLNRGGKLTLIASGTFAHNHAEHIFREHQQNVFPILLDEGELNTALNLPTASTNNRTGTVAKPVAEAELARWFVQLKAQTPSLTRDAIERAGKEKFGEAVTTIRLRALYRSIAPLGGQKRGRKSGR